MSKNEYPDRVVFYLRVRPWVWHQCRGSSHAWQWHTSTCPRHVPPAKSWLLWRIRSACCLRWRFCHSIGSSAFSPRWCRIRTSVLCTSTSCSLCTCGCSDRRQRRTPPMLLLPPLEQTAEWGLLPALEARGDTGLELQKAKIHLSSFKFLWHNMLCFVFVFVLKVCYHRRSMRSSCWKWREEYENMQKVCNIWALPLSLRSCAIAGLHVTGTSAVCNCHRSVCMWRGGFCPSTHKHAALPWSP